ncbi:FecR family protein [Noviherbaspirillum saxi]|uniref:Iron dicitrate transport regulator FecR n=1 Tax=Noviherbaspirillum saxi TaxID=2320863 RepID=A0A3A3FYE7_9BURK|nr:FecR family protein [Noviherbaspirillum saxi]RJF99221.1 iron dicitrate transport regulator FecR [Noviherbaspirillum saxi]
MRLQRSFTATKSLVFLGTLCAATFAYAAQVAGTVTNLSGPLLAKKPDGTVKVLSAKSQVEEGDTLITEKDTYARIKFVDNSEITLRPGTQMKIDSFSFDEEKPENDSATFNLVKGGLRAITGTLGKRNKERFGMNTPTATIGIRGTIFVAEYIPPAQPDLAAYAAASVASVGSYSNALPVSDAPAGGLPLAVLPMRETGSLLLAQAPDGGRAPGLYVQVLDGVIHLSNRGGSQSFSAGQFGFSPSRLLPPVLLPNNPGIRFSPPPAFSSSTGPQTGSGGNLTNSSNVDCEVR